MEVATARIGVQEATLLLALLLLLLLLLQSLLEDEIYDRRHLLNVEVNVTR